MKLVFCGTPVFAVPTLKLALRAGYDVPLVVTQPDRPVGRGQHVTAPPVKTAAMEGGIRVMQPEKIKNNAELRAELEAIAPDAILVVAYGRIIPAVDARAASAGESEPACVAAAEVSRGGAGAVGDRQWRGRDGRDDHASR